MVILGRGGAGKSALSRQLSDVTGIPAVELDALFWQPGPTPMDPSRWAACQQELVQRDRWILDGDLGPYDTALEVRLRAADTIVVLDFPFLRCAWRTLRRGREQAEYWRWVWAYRRRSLPPRPAAPSRRPSGAPRQPWRPDDPAADYEHIRPRLRDRPGPAPELGGLVLDELVIPDGSIAGYLIPGHTRPPGDGLLPSPRPPRAGSRWLPASDTTLRSAKIF